MHTFPVFPRFYRVSFEFKPTSTGEVEKWRSVLHVTIGRNNQEYGDRNPSVWAGHGSWKILFSSAVNGIPDNNHVTAPVNRGEWSTIVIQQRGEDEKIIYEIFLNGGLEKSEQNTDARAFYDVKVYVGNPWYEPESGEIRNLEISFPGN